MSRTEGPGDWSRMLKLLVACRAAMVESAKSPYKTEWRNMIAAIDDVLGAAAKGASGNPHEDAPAR